MKRMLRTTLLALLLPWSAAAGDYPKGELFGGYSYFRLLNTFNFHGWNASVTGNTASWLGVEADVSGQFGSLLHSVLANLPVFPEGIAPFDMRIHSILFGPRFSYRGSNKITPSAHFLLGATRIGVSGPEISSHVTAFSWAAGGGVDVQLTDALAFRAFQLDYLMTTFQTETQNHLRLSAGVVFRFAR